MCLDTMFFKIKTNTGKICQFKFLWIQCLMDGYFVIWVMQEVMTSIASLKNHAFEFHRHIFTEHTNKNHLLFAWHVPLHPDKSDIAFQQFNWLLLYNIRKEMQNVWGMLPNNNTQDCRKALNANRLKKGTFEGKQRN